MSRRKHVIVTGGSRGLGAAFVAGLISDGYRVSTCSRSRSKEVEKLASDETVAPHFYWSECNTEESDQVDRFVDEAVARGANEIYGLINNAGIARTGILATFPNVDTDAILKVNLLGSIYMSRAVARHLLRQRSGGRIVNITSIIGSRGYNGMAAYSASKAGLDGLTRALARELGPRKITVNSVAPGYVETDMSAELTAAQLKQIVNRTPLGRLATPDDVLGAVRFLLSDAAAMITGQTLLVDGGISC